MHRSEASLCIELAEVSTGSVYAPSQVENIFLFILAKQIKALTVKVHLVYIVWAHFYNNKIINASPD
jgi:hypothetical protein